MSSKELVNIEEQFKQKALALQKQIQSSGNFISTKGKKFTTPDGVEGKELRAVILAAAIRHEYYDQPFDKDNPSPPVCFAMGVDKDNMEPHETSIEMQIEEGENCNVCPMFQWRSDPNGKGKACKQQRILALLPAESPQGDILLLKVSPTGLKRINSYFGKISAGLGLPVRYTTLITMHEESDYPSLVFEMEGENKGWKDMWARVDEAEKVLEAVPQYTQAEETEERQPVKAASAPKRVSKKKKKVRRAS
jgi:hypothetical protein